MKETDIVISNTGTFGECDERILSDPRLAGKQDALRLAENMTAYHGAGLATRPGTRKTHILLDNDPDTGNYDYKFINIDKGSDENFLILLGLNRNDKSLLIDIYRIFSHEALVKELTLTESGDIFLPGAIDVQDIQFSIEGDAIILTHPKMPISRLLYTGLTFEFSIPKIINPPMTKLNEDSLTVAETKFPGKVVEVPKNSGQRLFRSKTLASTHANYELTVPPAEKDLEGSDYDLVEKGTYVVYDQRSTPQVVDFETIQGSPIKATEEDILPTPQQPGIYRIDIGGVDGFPHQSAFEAGYLLLSGVPGNRNKLYVSARGKAFDFTVSEAIPQPLDGQVVNELDQQLTENNASRQADFGRSFTIPNGETITNILSYNGVVIRTVNSTYRISDFNTASLNAENVQSGPVWAFRKGGAPNTKPILIGNSAVDYDAQKRDLYYFNFDGIEQGYSENPLSTVRNEVLIKESRIKRMELLYTEGSNATIVLLREDGVLLFCVYNIDQSGNNNIFAFSRVLFALQAQEGHAVVKDIISVRDSLLFLALDRKDGQGSWVEVFDSAVFTDAEDSIYNPGSPEIQGEQTTDLIDSSNKASFVTSNSSEAASGFCGGWEIEQGAGDNKGWPLIADFGFGRTASTATENKKVNDIENIIETNTGVVGDNPYSGQLKLGQDQEATWKPFIVTTNDESQTITPLWKALGLTSDGDKDFESKTKLVMSGKVNISPKSASQEFANIFSFGKGADQIAALEINWGGSSIGDRRKLQVRVSGEDDPIVIDEYLLPTNGSSSLAFSVEKAVLTSDDHPQSRTVQTFLNTSSATQATLSIDGHDITVPFEFGESGSVPDIRRVSKVISSGSLTPSEVVIDEGSSVEFTETNGVWTAVDGLSAVSLTIDGTSTTLVGNYYRAVITWSDGTTTTYSGGYLTSGTASLIQNFSKEISLPNGTIIQALFTRHEGSTTITLSGLFSVVSIIVGGLTKSYSNSLTIGDVLRVKVFTAQREIFSRDFEVPDNFKYKRGGQPVFYFSGTGNREAYLNNAFGSVFLPANETSDLQIQRLSSSVSFTYDNWLKEIESIFGSPFGGTYVLEGDNELTVGNAHFFSFAYGTGFSQFGINDKDAALAKPPPQCVVFSSDFLTINDLGWVESLKSYAIELNSIPLNLIRHVVRVEGFASNRKNIVSGMVFRPSDKTLILSLSVNGVRLRPLANSSAVLADRIFMKSVNFAQQSSYTDYFFGQLRLHPNIQDLDHYSATEVLQTMSGENSKAKLWNETDCPVGWYAPPGIEVVDAQSLPTPGTTDLTDAVVNSEGKGTTRVFNTSRALSGGDDEETWNLIIGRVPATILERNTLLATFKGFGSDVFLRRLGTASFVLSGNSITRSLSTDGAQLFAVLFNKTRMILASNSQTRTRIVSASANVEIQVTDNDPNIRDLVWIENFHINSGNEFNVLSSLYNSVLSGEESCLWSCLLQWYNPQEDITTLTDAMESYVQDQSIPEYEGNITIPVKVIYPIPWTAELSSRGDLQKFLLKDVYLSVEGKNTPNLAPHEVGTNALAIGLTHRGRDIWQTKSAELNPFEGTVRFQFQDPNAVLDRENTVTKRKLDEAGVTLTYRDKKPLVIHNAKFVTERPA